MTRVIAIAVLALTIGFVPCAHAQQIEIGAGVARACIGSEGGLCGSDAVLTPSGYLVAWFGERSAIQLRIDRLNLPDQNFTYSASTNALPFAVEVRRANRSRTLVGLQYLHHLLPPGGRIGPFFSAGFGVFNDRQLSSCQPATCEALPRHLYGGGPLGAQSTVHAAYFVGGGISALVTNRLLIRGGIMLLNIGGETLSTSATFASVGYRFATR